MLKAKIINLSKSVLLNTQSLYLFKSLEIKIRKIIQKKQDCSETLKDCFKVAFGRWLLLNCRTFKLNKNKKCACLHRLFFKDINYNNLYINFHNFILCTLFKPLAEHFQI